VKSRASAYVAGAALVALVTTGALGLKKPGAPRSTGSAAPPAPSAGPPVSARANGFAGPELSNRAAYIPAQCYAKTHDEKPGHTRNGCYVCHQASRAPNYVDDEDVQSTLSFASYATKNHWSNLLSAPLPANLPERELLAWVRASNYVEPDGDLILAKKLAKLPTAWDSNGDGVWNGFVPDCWFHTDANGFDSRPDGAKTGWRAFAFLPVPGMFMPTNGSAGDAFIRLPAAYRQDADGQDDETVYRVNLAIVEAYIRRENVPLTGIDAIDEKALGSDLDGDGVLGTAKRIGFVWPPKEGRSFHYIGGAASLDPKVDGWPVAGLFPRGTEFLHSVRYLDVQGGKVAVAARMKELRYMRKTRWLDYGELDQLAQAEAREKFKSPDKLKHVFADAERGVTTGVGWLMQGFIEDAAGSLRPQNVEETAACIGCHGGVGATTDATFTFARKLPASSAHGGWYLPALADLENIAEPRRADGIGEYAHWLTHVGAGDDFQTNDEVRRKFFRDDGTLYPAMARRLAKDVSLLLLPSPGRAIALDARYVGLARAQHFEGGRDVSVGDPARYETAVAQDAPTSIDAPVIPGWRKPEKVATR
jgi:hypothetical protein